MRLLQVLACVPGNFSATVGAAGSSDFDWDTITPSNNLQYHQCYDEYMCARLLVPLDWQDDSNENTVALAIAKLPAKVPQDDSSFGGTIFVNPGGPGGSGVYFILSDGHTLQDYVDGNKSYEMLSWDPRGVGFTTPQADCFGNITARDLSDLQEAYIGPLDASSNALRRQWAHSQAYGQLCEQGAVNDSILPYITTASVVHDMVGMLDSIEELRKKESQSLPRRTDVDSDTKLEASSGPLRIMYWGFSYGSLLGNAFASMYPGRVGRLVIDGIVDANDYMKGTWLANLQDTDKIVDYFYQSCFEFSDQCALRKPSDTRWEDLKQRVHELKGQLDERPASVLVGENLVVITGSELLIAFIEPLYLPLTTFIRLGQLLSDALEGNYTLLAQDVLASLPTIHDSCIPPNNATDINSHAEDALNGIKCGDGEDDTKLSFNEMEEYINELKAQSSTFGASWAMIRFRCTGWFVRPKHRFTGPFTTPAPDPSGADETRPAAPLLFMSSQLDPVTPLRNAVSMASAHPGAAWVVQESVGHTTIFVPSSCSRNIVREYLEHGTVPESGTQCPADCDPWHPCENPTINARAVQFKF